MKEIKIKVIEIPLKFKNSSCIHKVKVMVIRVNNGQENCFTDWRWQKPERVHNKLVSTNPTQTEI